MGAKSEENKTWVVLDTWPVTKTSFIFYTGIASWENLKYLHKVFFQKFIGLLSESSVLKLDPEELELNQRKIRHGFC